MVRWSGSAFRAEYVTEFNEGLWQEVRSESPPAGAFDEDGYIVPDFDAEACPKAFYFAPERKVRDDVILATNHAVIPEMRLCGMHPQTVMVASDRLDDIQWRYDELNHRILEALDAGPIDHDKAWELVDFLASTDYYGPPAELPGKPMDGAVTLFDLKAGTVKSRFGYHGDEPVTLKLSRYLV